MTKNKKITVTLTESQFAVLQAISTSTGIPRAKLVRETVDSLIQKYLGTVSDDFTVLVDGYLEERRTLLERLKC